MLFTSGVFLFLFLPIVLAVYFLLNNINAKNVFLLSASFLFYGWGEPSFCWLMALVILINYLAALLIDDTRNIDLFSINLDKLVLFFTVTINLSILCFFKYMGFFGNNLNFVFEKFALPSVSIGNIHLPLGISFFIFHSISYVVDVYRKKVRVQRNIFNMALYISLFPQLIAGPIVRYHDIAEQLTGRIHSLNKFAEGTRRFIIGLGKKVLLANLLALPCDKIFALPVDQLNTLSSWLGIICYTLQIYFDFSGYSDMAIGLGLMFGFRLPENFNYPYSARSMREFWQRWHISLSNWFRDYVYIPLGGNRVAVLHQCLNLFIVFFLCGLWHGANWQFIVWGLYHGFFLGLEKVLKVHKATFAISKIPIFLKNLFGHIYTLIAVILGWVLFRAENFNQAFAFYKIMFDLKRLDVFINYSTLALVNNGLIIFCLAIACLGTFRWRHQINRLSNSFVLTNSYGLYLLRDAWCMGVFVLAIIEIVSGTYNPFIYFRF